MGRTDLLSSLGGQREIPRPAIHLGTDFGEEIERRASDAKLILETAAKHGVPVEMLWKPAGNPSIQPPIVPAR